MFEFSLEVPADLTALHLVQNFIKDSAELCGYSAKELQKFPLIAEEAFVYTIRLLKADQSESKVRVVAKTDEKNLIISFLDKGIPFDSEEEYNDLEKLELMIIRASCSDLKWVSLGKEGKELRMLFPRPVKDITQYQIPAPKVSKVTPSAENVIIRRLNLTEASKLSRLIYKTYGYTYPNEDLYYPNVIKQLNENGDLVSVVAVDTESNDVVGHYAIERYGQSDTAEIGQAVLAPEYRGKGLLIKLRKKLEETGRDIGLKGIYAQSVTSHTKTQRVNEKFGARVSGITFGLVPEVLNFKKMDIRPLSQRETCFYYFKNFIVDEGKEISPPENHRKIITKIYENIHVPFNLRDTDYVKQARSGIDANFHASWGLATIDITAIGEDFREAFTQAWLQLRYVAKADVILLHLPISEGRIDDIVDQVEERGFFFCGVAPYHLNGRDAMRFEYVNTLIDTSKINAYSDFGQEILGYCAEMMRKAQN